MGGGAQGARNARRAGGVDLVMGRVEQPAGAVRLSGGLMSESSTAFRIPTADQAPGCVLTVAKPDEVIVWLIGEIDSALGIDLARVAEHAPRVARRVVIDGSRVTFCDSTVAHFVALTAAVMPVVVRRPSRLLVDLLATTGLYHQVIVDPGRSCA
jgi:hypothetical protein